MKLQNPFIKPLSEYRRNLNFYEQYVLDQGLALSLQTGKPVPFCRDWVREKTMPGGELGIVDPKVMYLMQESEGNRVQRTGTMTEYLQMVSSRQYPMAPTFTAYQNPNVRESVLAKYIKEQLANRSKNKKLKLKYENQGDKLMAGIYNNRQNRNKIKNNSVSGAHGTTSSVLFLQSGHSTLTSTCRSASSTTNAMIERFLTGNRHYWSHTVAINNITSVLNNVDYDLIQQVMNRWNIGYPSYEVTIEGIRRCTDLYWSSTLNAKYFAKIERLVRGMTPLQRAAYLFTGDLWHLEQYASGPIRDLMSYLADLPTEPVEDPQYWIDRLGGDEIALISITCDQWIMAEGRDRHLFTATTKAADTYKLIGAAAKRICVGMELYADLLKAFFGSENMPCGMSYFPFSVRRSVVASDTDSCIFTTQDWTTWYVGQLDWSRESYRAHAGITYLCSLYTSHTLAMLSANMGVAQMHMGLLEMKNEYAFPVFSLTSMGKHYFAAMSSQEGNVYSKPKWEIKGANLKNSKAPVEIMERADGLIKHILSTVMAGGEIDLKQILIDIAKEEIQIKNALLKGDADYFSTAQVKAQKGYKSENSPYLQYLMWEEVFAPKYGSTQAPPYAAIKVSLDLDNSTQVKQWLTTMKDQALAQRMREWMFKHGKQTLGTVYLPRLALGNNGIPEEFVEHMSVRSLIYNIMSTYYVILESLGVFMRNDHITRLVSDDFHEDTVINIIMDQLAA